MRDRFMKPLCISWLLVCLAGASAVAAGQDGSETQSDASADVSPGVAPVIYETATVTARELRDAAIDIDQVGRADIERAELVDAASALVAVPGVWVRPSARGSQVSAQLRGGDPNFTLIVVDGVPLNDSTDQLGGAYDLSTLPIHGVERVEVAQGPQSVSYGSAALAGAIQLFSRAGTASTSLDVRPGDGDDEWSDGSLWFGGPVGESTASVALHRSAESERVGDSDFELLTGSVTWDRDLETGSLGVRGRWASSDVLDYTEGSGGPLLGTGELRSSDRDEESLGIFWELAQTSWRHRLQVAASRQELDRLSPAIPPQIPPGTELTEFERQRGSWSSTRSFAQSFFGAGVDFEREDGTNSSLLLLPDFLGGALPGDYASDRSQTGIFVEGMRRSTPGGGSLTTELGLRYDDPEDIGGELSPRLGISWRPGDASLTVRAVVGAAFKLPSFYALSSPRALGGNPDLEPETSESAELGLRWQSASGALSSEISFYEARYQDLIDFDFTTFQLVNRDRVRARGIVGDLGWQVAERGGVDVSLTVQDVESRATGEELLRRPEWFGSARAWWRPRADLLLALDFVASGESLDQQVPLGSPVTLSDYGIWGFAASWQASTRWRLWLRGENLVDDDYETQAGFPGPSRSLRAGVALGFGGGSTRP